MENKKALFIIVNSGFSDHAIEIARNCGAGGATVIIARGSGANYARILGIIDYEPEKEIIISVVSEEVGIKIIEAIKENAGQNTPTSGICFMMPVDCSTTLSSR